VKPDQLLAMMRDGAVVKLFVNPNRIGKRKYKWVIVYPDSTTLNTQSSVLLPLVKKGLVKSRRWFGGSLGSEIYEVVK